MHIPLRLAVFLLVSVTLIACSQSTAPSPSDQEVTEVTLSTSSVDVPYIINSAEVTGAATIVTSAQVKPTDPSGIGTVEGYLSTEERGVLLSTLRDSNQEVIALDVLVGDVKQSLSFNAENSAKAQVMFTLGLFDVPYIWMVEAYGQIEAHELFPQLVQLHRDAQRYADTDESAELSVSIAIDIKADLLQQEEEASSGLLEAQRVLKDFSGDQSLWIEEHPDTPGKFTVHANSALDQRIFVYETSALNGSSPDLSYLGNNASVATNVGSESYVSRPGTFPGGFRNVFDRTSATFTLSDPGCKVYTVAASALAYGPGGSFLDTENNPNYENFANATYSLLSLAGLSIDGNSTKASEAVLNAYAVFSSAEIGYSEGENLANALRTAEVFSDSVSEALTAILQVQTGETLGENIAEVVLAQDAADVAKKAVRRALFAQEAFYVGTFISSYVQERFGNIPTALISTGGPEFEMELLDTSLTGRVGEVVTGAFLVKNTGCRAMEYEARANPSTFPTEVGAPGSGTVEVDAEVQQNFEVTCDRVAAGTAKLSVVAYDPVAKVDIAAVNPVVDVACHKVTLNAYPSSAAINLGGNTLLRYYVGGDATNSGVTWSAAEGEIEKAGSTYYYYAPKDVPKKTPFNVEVTATSVADSSVSKTFEVEIREIALGNAYASSSSIPLGSATTLRSSVINDSTGSGIKWTAAEGEIVKAGNTYYYYAPTDVPRTTPFTVEITAASIADPSVSKSFEIGIKKVELSRTYASSMSIPLGSATTLRSSVINDSTGSGIEWTAAEGEIVKSGRTFYWYAPKNVPRKTPFKVAITATSIADPSVSKTFEVDIKEVKLGNTYASSMSIPLGSATTLRSSVINDATSSGVKWTAAEGEIVQSGRTFYWYAPKDVPRKTPFKVAITATSIADPSVSKTFEVDIKKIELGSTYASSTSILTESATTLRSSVINDATNSGVKWTATGGRIVQSGRTFYWYAPKSPGTYTITATSVADPSVSKSFTITARPRPPKN